MKVLGQLEDASLENRAGNPAAPQVGRTWLDTTLNKVRVFVGGVARHVMWGDETDALPLKEIVSPGTPSAGILRLFSKSDKNIYTVDSAGLEKKVLTGQAQSSDIGDGQVSTAKIGDGQVITAKIGDSAVTTPKIADGNVTSAKIQDNAVTRAKLSALGLVASGGTANSNTTSGSRVDVSPLSVTITTTGRPVLVALIPAVANGTFTSRLGSRTSSGATAEGGVFIMRGSTDIFETVVGINASGASNPHIMLPVSSIFTIDTGAAAGTHTYKVQAYALNSGALELHDCKLVAFEL